MTKDRFKELQENIEIYGDGVDISTINHFAVIDMEAPFMDDFFNQIDVLRNTVNKIVKLIDDVEYLQHAMLEPQIANGTKEKLEEKMNKIKSLGHNVRIALKQMKQIQEMQDLTQQKNIRRRIIETQIDVITKKFCAIMDKYYQSIITHRKRCTEKIQRQCQLVQIVKTDDEIEEIVQNGHLTMFPEIIIKNEQAKQRLDVVKLRHQELIEIENNIQELHDMFFDVANLIEFQGDQIEYVDEKVQIIADIVENSRITIGAKKVPHCFPLKLSKRRFVSSLVSLLSRLFPSCI